MVRQERNVSMPTAAEDTPVLIPRSPIQAFCGRAPLIRSRFWGCAWQKLSLKLANRPSWVNNPSAAAVSGLPPVRH
jgi:hypothetical protein